MGRNLLAAPPGTALNIVRVLRKLTISSAAFAALASCALMAVSTAGGWSPSEVPDAARSVPEPAIEFDPIPYDHARKRQMAAYSKRHYGEREWRLTNPKVIVLHYTATSTYAPVHNTFAANSPSLGESPGVCAQFVVDKDGAVYQQTRLYVRCRHTIGLNHVAIGVEMVQEAVSSRHGADQAILGRRKQARAAIQLVAWLKQRYGISMKNVIGHAMANDSPHFKDLRGWRNDHVDWRAADVREFRGRVAAAIRSHRGD